MNSSAAASNAAQKQETLAPGDNEEDMFLKAIQDPEARKEVVRILKRAGLIHG